MTNLYMQGSQGEGTHELMKSHPADAPSRFPRNGTHVKFMFSYILSEFKAHTLLWPVNIIIYAWLSLIFPP